MWVSWFGVVVGAKLFEGRAPGGTGVVNQDIDPAEFGDCCVYHFLDVSWVLHVAPERPRPYAELLQFLCGLLATLLLASAEHQIRAHLREALGHLASQTNGASSDNGHTPCEIKKLLRVHFECLPAA